MKLQFGDALLILGRREKLVMLANDPDFLLLSESLQVPPKKKKAPIAVLIMAAVIIPVLFGVLPISIAAVIGSALICIGIRICLRRTC